MIDHYSNHWGVVQGEAGGAASPIIYHLNGTLPFNVLFEGAAFSRLMLLIN